MLPMRRTAEAPRRSVAAGCARLPHKAFRMNALRYPICLFYTLRVQRSARCDLESALRNFENSGICQFATKVLESLNPHLLRGIRGDILLLTNGFAKPYYNNRARHTCVRREPHWYTDDGTTVCGNPDRGICPMKLRT